ncbi:NAD(P)/FAD-dependent oxidoreductase [Muricoccus radiodurans]|uniref:NAD(P)/FAD-dependent oxidoreductase n=1 Tax=Muricoccus radiodurans TaxID=2231721 RepID=UPI003CE674E3
MAESFDVVVLGGGVIGASVAFHLTRLGCRRVLLLDRGQVAGGTTAQSSGILRTYYSVRPNVAVAKAALAMFQGFKDLLDDEEAECGIVRTGYLAVAPDGPMATALRGTVATQAELGVESRLITPQEAGAIHPWLRVDDLAVAAYEPEAGFADPTMTANSFARAARRGGAVIRQDTAATGLLRENGRITGVRTAAGDIAADHVVSCLNVWSPLLAAWTGAEIPCVATRHIVASFAADAPYTPAFPVLKDLGSALKLYSRSYGRTEILVGAGDEGDEIADPDGGTGDIPMDWVAEAGEQLAHRIPRFAEHGGFVRAWTGLYDTTPDWNPVLGPVPGLEGLSLAFGFSGHGFKLSPMIGRMLAQGALGLEPDLPLAPYRATRFAEGKPLTGAFGAGAVS